MKSLKAKLISCIVSITALGSMIAFGLSSFAWYSKNKIVTAKDMVLRTMFSSDVMIEGDEYTVYGYDLNEDEPVVLTNDLKLGDYNIFVPGRNTYNRRILRLTLTYPRGVVVGTKLQVTMRCNADLFAGDYVDTKISNLIQFKFYDNHEGTIPQIDEEHTIRDVYDECVTLFDSMTDFYSFVEVDSGNCTKPDKVISFEIDLPSLATEQSEYTTDFLIEYNYNDDLVNYYREHTNTKFDLSFFDEGKGIPFTQDIEIIEFDLTEKAE